MATTKLGIVTNRSTGDQVGEMQPMSREQAQTIKKAAQSSGTSVDVKDPNGNNLAEEMSPEDGRNVAMEIAKSLRDALREHGDEIKAMYLSNSTNQGTTIKVQYMPDDQGNAEEDEFVFRWPEGKLRLDNVADPVDLCDLQKQSGTVLVQKDLVKNGLLSFLKSHDSVDQPSQQTDPNALPDGPVAEEQLWESEECQNAFCQAVDMYRQAKNKESIKNLFRAARPYQKGNTIQEKLKGAVEWYNIYKENPPKNTKEQVFLEDSDADEGQLLEKVRQGVVKPLEGALSNGYGLALHFGDFSEGFRPFYSNLMDNAIALQHWITDRTKNLKPVVGFKENLEEGYEGGVITALQKISEGLDILKAYINRTEDTHLGAYYRELESKYQSLFDFCKRQLGGIHGFDDKLDETWDVNDPIANGEDTNYPFGRDNDEFNSNHEDFDDEPVVHEGDEFGPEAGDQIEYEGGTYKLYGYCGHEVVLQNVDDDRDFKLVTPEKAGFKSPEKGLDEVTTWVDPDNLPDDNEVQGI